MTIAITPEAGEQLRGIMEGNAGAEGGLRLWVQSTCGCGNVGYGMGIDEVAEGDATYSSEGIRVIMDPGSASLLGGATVDFVDNGLHGSGFVIHTLDQLRGAGPSGCGCGAH